MKYAIHFLFICALYYVFRNKKEVKITGMSVANNNDDIRLVDWGTGDFIVLKEYEYKGRTL